MTQRWNHSRLRRITSSWSFGSSTTCPWRTCSACPPSRPTRQTFRFPDRVETNASLAYPGQVLKGIRFTLTDRDAYRPLATSLRMIDLIRRLHPDQFQWTAANSREPNMLTIERHGGTARLRRAIEEGTLPELLREWERDQATFREKRAPYLIYP